MSLTREFGGLDSLNKNGECEYYDSCDRDAVVRMPDLRPERARKIDLCPDHLALWIERSEGDAALEKAKCLNVTDHIPQRALVSLDDLPEQIHNGKLRRIGIDHTGSGHYIEREAATTIILVDARLETTGSRELSDDRELTDWIDYVESERGWVAIDPTVFQEVGDDA